MESVSTRRIGLALLLGTVAYSVPVTAALAVFLPDRVARIAPEHKVALLAVLTGVAALVSLVANLVFGALSDRTRTRFGARSPWIVGGAVACAALLVPVALTESFTGTLLSWCVAVAASNAATAAVNAVLPDRVPVEKRATASAMLGLGLLIGSAAGSVLGAVFVDRPLAGLGVAGGVFVVLALLTVVLAPDHDNRAEELTPASPAEVARAAVSFPRGAPDFYWALSGRLALVLGYFMVNGYQLYILTDHVGLSEDRAAQVVGINAVLFLLTAILGIVVAGPASDRLRRRKVFVVAASVVAIAAVVPPLLSATTGAMHAFAVIGGLAFGAYFAVDAALVSEVLPDARSRARDLGILNMANTGGQVLGPGVSAGLVALGAGFTPVFVGAIVMAALGAVLVAPIRSVR